MIIMEIVETILQNLQVRKNAYNIRHSANKRISADDFKTLTANMIELFMYLDKHKTSSEAKNSVAQIRKIVNGELQMNFEGKQPSIPGQIADNGCQLSELHSAKVKEKEDNMKTDENLCMPSKDDLYRFKDSIDKAVIEIKGEFDFVSDVWVGYRAETPTERVYVAVVPLKEKSSCIELFNSSKWPLIPQCLFQVSPEGKLVTYSEQAREKSIDQAEEVKIHGILSRASKKLMEEHSNLQMINFCSVRSKSFGKHDACLLEETCIVLYVPIKGIIPVDEKPFPTDLEGMPTDVREGYYIPYGPTKASEYHKELVSGCKMSVYGGSSGTLGGFVETREKKVCCLTCAHVCLDAAELQKLRSNEQQLNQDIKTESKFFIQCYQPDALDYPKTHFGKVIACRHRSGDNTSVGVDVALVEIKTQRQPRNGCFPDIDPEKYEEAGFTSDQAPEYTCGEIVHESDIPRMTVVFKFGAVTELTRGLFRVKGIHVRSTYYPYTLPGSQLELYHQIEILNSGKLPFAQPGDSGALVFIVDEENNDEVKAVGVLVGGSTDDTVIATPMHAVLSALELQPPMKTFNKTCQSSTTRKRGKFASTAHVLAVENKLGAVEKAVEIQASTVNKKFDTIEKTIKKQGDGMKSGFEEIANLIRNIPQNK